MNENVVGQSGQWTEASDWCFAWRSVKIGRPLKCLLGVGLFLFSISDLQEEAEGSLVHFPSLRMTTNEGQQLTNRGQGVCTECPGQAGEMGQERHYKVK